MSIHVLHPLADERPRMPGGVGREQPGSPQRPDPIWRTRRRVSTVVPMSAPSWLLLAWVGAAATCSAALTGATLGGRTRRAWALIPAPRSTAHALSATLLAGMVAYPIIYGVIFEAMQRSDVAIGFILGSVHAIIAFALSRPGVQPGTAFRMAAMHLAYGSACALLYVTP